MTTDYLVYGGVLRSDVVLPALPDRESDEAASVDWRLRVRRGSVGKLPTSPLGEDEVEPGVRVRLFRRNGTYLLQFDDTGVFRFSRDGSRIDWFASEDADLDDVRLDVLGRVLPFALHLDGLYVLHASAVISDRGAIALVGPKGHGKSTLAHALVESGAILLTDDALPIRMDPVPRALPGIRRLRLRHDVVDLADLPAGKARRHRGRVEVGFEVDEGDLAERVLAPVAAIYLLAPRPPGEGDPVARSGRLHGPRATTAVMSQAKLARLLQPWAGEQLLRSAASIAGQVPVRRLELSRDLSRLEEVARFILASDEGVPNHRTPGE